MELSLKVIEDAGGFAPAQPEMREINWQVTQNGKLQEYSATAYIRKKSFATVSMESQAANARSDVVAARIASSVVDANNKPVFTVQDITGSDVRGPMCESLTLALLSAIADVNGYISKAEDEAEKN
ncbi:phage tail assembly chaperone family protein, TAC [Alishewanella sp. 16-MA]|uniref:Phage tail assembly chaperone family protein, TAC n=1 Tax=Alishewanella maricola TaxID=2795740 RepID=A0ABS8C234_9ALTE|nr:phage tail assembly chaperone family protein, TAC [Alishewanella maricola]